METMSSLQMVERARDGKFFTVEFIKRTDGTLRTMRCRRGVSVGITGKGMAYDALSYALMTVWDVDKGGYRSIPLDRLVRLRMGRRTYTWNGRRFERVMTNR